MAQADVQKFLEENPDVLAQVIQNPDAFGLSMDQRIDLLKGVIDDGIGRIDADIEAQRNDQGSLLDQALAGEDLAFRPADTRQAEVYTPSGSLGNDVINDIVSASQSLGVPLVDNGKVFNTGNNYLNNRLYGADLKESVLRDLGERGSGYITPDGSTDYIEEIAAAGLSAAAGYGVNSLLSPVLQNVGQGFNSIFGAENAAGGLAGGGFSHGGSTIIGDAIINSGGLLGGAVAQGANPSVLDVLGQDPNIITNLSTDQPYVEETSNEGAPLPDFNPLSIIPDTSGGMLDDITFDNVGPQIPPNYNEQINSAYQDVLNRQAGPEGLAWWNDQINSGAVELDNLLQAVYDGGIASGEISAPPSNQPVVEESGLTTGGMLDLGFGLAPGGSPSVGLPPPLPPAVSPVDPGLEAVREMIGNATGVGQQPEGIIHGDGPVSVGVDIDLEHMTTGGQTLGEAQGVTSPGENTDVQPDSVVAGRDGEGVYNYEDALDAVTDWIQGSIPGAPVNLGALKIEDFLRNGAETIGAVINGDRTVGEVAEEIWESIQTKAQEAWEGVLDAPQEAISAVMATGGNLVEWIRTLGDKDRAQVIYAAGQMGVELPRGVPLSNDEDDPLTLLKTPQKALKQM